MRPRKIRNYGLICTTTVCINYVKKTKRLYKICINYAKVNLMREINRFVCGFYRGKLHLTLLI